jgi:hypothetical protein
MVLLLIEFTRIIKSRSPIRLAHDQLINKTCLKTLLHNFDLELIFVFSPLSHLSDMVCLTWWDGGMPYAMTVFFPYS